jgi:hypothetical protein
MYIRTVAPDPWYHSNGRHTEPSVIKSGFYLLGTDPSSRVTLHKVVRRFNRVLTLTYDQCSRWHLLSCHHGSGLHLVHTLEIPSSSSLRPYFCQCWATISSTKRKGMPFSGCARISAARPRQPDPFHECGRASTERFFTADKGVNSSPPKTLGVLKFPKLPAGGSLKRI